MISFCIGGTCWLATVQVKQNDWMWCENSVVAWCSKCLGWGVLLYYGSSETPCALRRTSISTAPSRYESCTCLILSLTQHHGSSVESQDIGNHCFKGYLYVWTEPESKDFQNLCQESVFSAPFTCWTHCFMANIPPLQVPACLLEWFFLVVRVWPRECKPRWIPNGQLLARWYVLVAQLCCK